MITKRYTEADIIRVVAENKSMAGCIKALGLKAAGGNYSHFKKNLQRLNLDTSHWFGSAWNKGEQLKDWSNYTSSKVCKGHLIILRGNICESCHNSEWMKNLIKLEVHHLDGNKTNNTLENLQLLCPNCHSFTSTWRKRTDNKVN